MTQDTPKKKYPLTTKEVAIMLGIQHTSEDLPLASFAVQRPPVSLPTESSEHDGHSADKHVEKSHNGEQNYVSLNSKDHGNKHQQSENGKNQPVFVKFGKAIFPYVAIFSIGIFLYYFFFTTVDLGSIFKSNNQSVETALEVLEQQEAEEYQKWIVGFYYDVSDEKVLDPDADNSGNGLTNFQKYLLNLNPKTYDTLGNGMPDSQALSNGINPITGLPLTEKQKEIINKYIDLEVVNNRLTLSGIQSVEALGQNVAGAAVNISNETNVTPRNEPILRMGNSETGIDVNTEVEGRLVIPDLNVDVPIIWSKSQKAFATDLQKGVIHYPGTALPGRIGTTYIAGHSSNFVWAKGNYNQVFARLGDLANNASFAITITDKNGKNTSYNYIITSKKEFTATDPEQFKNGGQSVVALSTCWPVGSTAKRLVVFGQLIQSQ